MEVFNNLFQYNDFYNQHKTLRKNGDRGLILTSDEGSIEFTLSPNVINIDYDQNVYSENYIVTYSPKNLLF